MRITREIIYLTVLSVLLAATIAAGIFWERLQPPQNGAAGTAVFEIKSGEGARLIAAHLAAAGLIRSPRAFLIYATLRGQVRHFQTGLYELPQGKDAGEMITMLTFGEGREMAVTIPEGSSFFDIDDILSGKGLLAKGAFRDYVKAKGQPVEGYLFPDTYRFFLRSSPAEIYDKMSVAFAEKIAPLLPEGPEKAKETLILASILEKEVANEEDRRIVAGILLKRLEAGQALQVDATVCYGKRLRNNGASCYPVSVLDTKTDDPYNTYLHTGWPPGPIGNPGIAAVQAALSPVKSPYWYYLSDPVTKQTIFSKSLEEHEANRSKYLLNR